ncbi:MAG: hypothetical protein ABW213_13855 [Tardiphaga sp.]
MEFVTIVGHDGNVAFRIPWHVPRDRLRMSAGGFCIGEFDADRILQTDAIDDGEMISGHALTSFLRTCCSFGAKVFASLAPSFSQVPVSIRDEPLRL